ncbi:MAG: tetratricopeptide repeat protein [Pseudomonadota bacterium]|nr:tetratricopeptide repeat protein [Pseudomonadota bacterium]
MLPLPLALLLAAPSAFAADQATGPSDPAEWATFQDTLERYSSRMKELQADTRSILDTYEAEERAKISSGYGNAIQRAEDSEAALRRVAIARIEAFLAKYPTSPHTADMLFRLADLYFEETEVAFIGQMEEYGRLEAQLENNPTLALPPPPLKTYTRSMDLYKRLIAQYPSYENLASTYYMLAWCLSAQNGEHYDPEAARDVYLTIVERFPGSPFSNDANMRLGEYYFDLTGPRENPTAYVATAIKYYKAVLADGPSGRNYDESIYKLGWSHYKVNEYEEALGYLVKLLDYSDAQFIETTGKVSNMRPEAVEYLAISYADMADRQGKTPVEVATTHLNKVGERKWQHDVVERLAEILLIQAKFEASIDTYAYLQKKWPLDPENPVYQYEISQIYGKKMGLVDLDRSAKAMEELSVRYTEGTPWYNANKSNPEAIAKARGYIETSLGDVATRLLLQAQETNSPQVYAAAAEKYGEFLEKFPFADAYNEYEWYRALGLFGSNQFVEAEKQYVQILKNDRSPYREGARYQLMKSREQIVQGRYGSLIEVPPGAVVERVDRSAFGKDITRYMMSDEHKAFIQSCDDLAVREFTDPEWAPLLEKNRRAFAYLPAQILFKHGHYAEARPRLEKIFAMYPGSDEASYSASMLVDSYANEGDLQKVAKLTVDLRDAKNSLVFDDIREQAKFNLAQQYADKGERAEAAEAFVEFTKEFPKSKYYSLALYNVGNNYDFIGKSRDANRYFERFIAEFPADERAKALYFRIADGYSATLQLDKAISYYEQLVKLFPDYEFSPAALFNAAFLRVGVGDHAGAARMFERYATQYSDQPDAEAAYWRAGDQWALVSETEALDFYARYVKRYPRTDGNHLVEAWYRTAKIYEKRGDSRRSVQAWSQVQGAYGATVGAGLTARTRSLAAEGALGQLVSRYETFKVVKWTTSEAKNVDILLKTKPEELKIITEGAVQLIQTYQDYDTAAAALYLQGMGYFAYADMAYNIPSPKGLSEDEEIIFRDTIDQQFRIPAEDRAKSRLVAALEKARGEKRWSEWNTKALIALNDRYPNEYPAERKEARGAAGSVAVPFAGPESIELEPTTSGGGQ